MLAAAPAAFGELILAAQASKKQESARRKVPAGGAEVSAAGGRRGVMAERDAKPQGDILRGPVQPAAPMHAQQQHFRQQHPLLPPCRGGGALGANDVTGGGGRGMLCAGGKVGA